jgi:ABC-type amino acid transport substrate-binding protein
MLGDNSLYIGFSPENPNSQVHADIFDRGINAMRENGELKRILTLYGAEDWENR